MTNKTKAVLIVIVAIMVVMMGFILNQQQQIQQLKAERAKLESTVKNLDAHSAKLEKTISEQKKTIKFLEKDDRAAQTAKAMNRSMHAGWSPTEMFVEEGKTAYGTSNGALERSAAKNN